MDRWAAFCISAVHFLKSEKPIYLGQTQEEEEDEEEAGTKEKLQNFSFFSSLLLPACIQVSLCAPALPSVIASPWRRHWCSPLTKGYLQFHWRKEIIEIEEGVYVLWWTELIFLFRYNEFQVLWLSSLSTVAVKCNSRIKSAKQISSLINHPLSYSMSSERLLCRQAPWSFTAFITNVSKFNGPGLNSWVNFYTSTRKAFFHLKKILLYHKHQTILLLFSYKSHFPHVFREKQSCLISKVSHWMWTPCWHIHSTWAIMDPSEYNLHNYSSSSPMQLMLQMPR